jgi:hypothetical protein
MGMNRASLALVLLLGTVAAALVAAGVARDLERAEIRGSTPAIGIVIPTAPALQPEVEAVVPTVSRPIVVLHASGRLPVLNESILVIPASSQTLQVDLNAWMKRFIAIPKFEAAQNERPLPRVTQSRKHKQSRKFARLLARSNAGDTAKVDALIRDNDGIDDPRSSVPFGHVRIAGRLIELEHRGSVKPLELNWTGRLHYGLDPRQTLRHLDPLAALVTTKAARLPGETPRLWSADRRAVIDSITATLRDVGKQTVAAAEQIAAIVTLGQWAHQQVDLGLEVVARHLKREAWLATVPMPVKSAPVRSAQRLKADKG